MVNNRKRKQGVVHKLSGVKSACVLVEFSKRHSLYGKVVKCSKKYMVHDESELLKVGDEVIIEESRPYSKLKKWQVLEVIK